MDTPSLKKVANAIRVLSADAVQAANSGHPGLPLGCADLAATLWANTLVHLPKDSSWANRDRFVLSAGHGSMLIYSLLHLFDYQVSMEDLKNFRQLQSKTPGHPEYGYTDGVETTTGPLGQGIANAVGMALASKINAKKYNTSDHTIVDNHIYALCGDGCMMEGVASEAASLAGHLNLDNLTLIYDSNKITIEGSTDLAFTEDVGKRFEAYGWETVTVDGHNIEEVNNALQSTRNTKKPSLIIAQTTIGKGSPNKSGTHKVHGAPLGTEEADLMRQALNFDQAFSIPQETYSFCQKAIAKNQQAYDKWQKTFEDWSKANPKLKEKWQQSLNQEIPQLELPEFESGGSVASRKSSSTVLGEISKQIDYLYGGSADLDCSNLSRMPDEFGDINTNQFEGRNLHFGVREHAMGAICNGMQLYGNIRVYCATFLVFSDYMRHAIRLAALMKLPIIYIFTHDSLFVGEDGPTHQPVEHKTALEIIPNLTVIRPADANEVRIAWQVAMNRHDSPTALLLSRQNLRTFSNNRPPVEKGAYIIKTETSNKIDLILMASGSEVALCLDAAKILEEKNISVRVVSVPSVKLFEEQTPDYKESVFPSSAEKRFAVDYGISNSWHRYLGLEGKAFTLERFGECGPGGEVAEHFGFTPENIARQAADIVRVKLEV